MKPKAAPSAAPASLACVESLTRWAQGHLMRLSRGHPTLLYVTQTARDRRCSNFSKPQNPLPDPLKCRLSYAVDGPSERARLTNGQAMPELLGTTL